VSGLFEPLRIRGIELRNRIVFAPVVTNFGLRNQQALQYYLERAKGGVGLIIVHGTPVDLLLKPKWAQGLSPLTMAVHEQGAKIVLQLWHGNELHGQKVAPSARESYREITPEEIRTVVEKFAIAARQCLEAGFDGVEVHGAHGYFIHQFFSPLTNQRSDEYGGNAEKRMLLGMELAVAMREAMRERGLLLYRHSAIDGIPGGSSLEESARFAKALQNHWLDVIDVSAGMGGGDDLSIPTSSAPEGTHADLAAQIKAQVTIPVIAVGKVQTRAGAEKILQEGKADLVALGRQLLADPYWPEKVDEGKEDEVVFCTYCNHCTGEMHAGRPIACPQNPKLGREEIP
jgi:2,4-dienoyl-CoA reductase-like NADH-dependent reductase (Old Yellow Enzyme family)